MTPIPDSGPYDSSKVYDVPLKSIFADERFNCRGIVDITTIIGLADNIKETGGLLQPIVVQTWVDSKRPHIRFRVVAGYRRFKAHVFLKVDTIRCLVRENLSELDARFMNLAENVQRVDLNIKQEARGLEPMKLAGMQQEEVARRLNVSRGWVQTRYYLLELPDDIQNEAAAGMLTGSQIHEMRALVTPELQYEYLRQIKDKLLLGKRRDPRPPQKNQTKIRGQQAIFEMQDLIRELYGQHNLATKVLGWASGVVSDLEVHQTMATELTKEGKFYSVPIELYPPMPVAIKIASQAAVDLGEDEDEETE